MDAKSSEGSRELHITLDGSEAYGLERQEVNGHVVFRGLPDVKVPLTMRVDAGQDETVALNQEPLDVPYSAAAFVEVSLSRGSYLCVLNLGSTGRTFDDGRRVDIYRA